LPKVHPVKIALAERGETQVDCAHAVGVVAPLLTQVLNGHRAPWPALRRRLSEHLGRSEAELFPAGAAESGAA
jgi:transcriptional regulator with XRE-family HTH domain